MELVDRRMSAAERRQQGDVMIHKIRWRAVTELHSQHMPWAKCWSAAAEILDDTEAGGSAETIRASYKLIQRAGGEQTTFKSYQHARRGGNK
jgi:hypothetical protein